MEPTQYYLIGSDGRPYGPVHSDTVRQWIREGRADARTRANLLGATEWQALATVAEFAAAFPPPPVPTVATPPALAPWQPRRTHPLALWGFICSLLSLSCCCCCCAGPMLSLVGIVLSVVGLMEVNRRPELYEGRGLAVAGICLGAVGLLLGLAGTGASLVSSVAQQGGPHAAHWH